MKIRIILGADRTGKSTISDYFKSRGYEYYHFSAPEKSPYEEYRGFLDTVLKDPKNSSKKIIIDRYMYCEFPYSKHYGRTTDMTYDKMVEIESEILDLDPTACTIYCENDIDTNWKLIQDEGKKEFKSKSELERLREEYHNVIAESVLKNVQYDFTAGDTPEKAFMEARG